MDWKHRLFALESADGVIESIPSMMKAQELDLLYSLVKNYYKGEGYIVDAGIFMGASTKCFIEGLAANPPPRRVAKPTIHSFERARRELDIFLERFYRDIYKDQTNQIAIRFKGDLARLTTNIDKGLATAARRAAVKAKASNG